MRTVWAGCTADRSETALTCRESQHVAKLDDRALSSLTPHTLSPVPQREKPSGDSLRGGKTKETIFAIAESAEVCGCSRKHRKQQGPRGKGRKTLFGHGRDQPQAGEHASGKDLYPNYGRKNS